MDSENGDEMNEVDEMEDEMEGEMEMDLGGEAYGGLGLGQWLDSGESEGSSPESVASADRPIPSIEVEDP
ncbi:hypothetical protein M406DRAFT_354842 [Cryphonectria parasitica EP155]|uniref:Uncharacterized protein n=1 Tax=Cryphonectria parasitica (strain ATCC 38755 / EP155) TaxID=660469 RepID=A0A9P5CW19_CRYP1|nr:uncharacterized protein M406DRAFT_354842 [Cryphonectria parasitica EP155]KAF3771396.1 hypothetical protein M406DRAFT_354842 [Cryphonectria parasitica EP155]